jgi:hypothetical protein
MIERMFIEGSLVWTRRASEIVSSGRSASPNREQRSVPLALVAGIQAPSAEWLTGDQGGS